MLSEPEYYDKNNTVTLILRNNIAEHSATISDATMARIERILSSLSPTEVGIVQFLFTKHQATIEDFMEHIDKTETAIRSAISKLIDLNILVKNTEKQRDKNAIYTFKKS